MTNLGHPVRSLVAGLLIPAAAGGQSWQGLEPAGAGLPVYRPSESAAVLAVAEGGWIPVPTDPHDLLGDYAFLPPYATEDAEGQLFRVLESEAGREVSDSDGRFVAVPWTVGCGCAEEGWDQPGWVQAGDTVAFLLTRTRQRMPWDGPPVFDVLGWHQPYPVGDFIPYWRPGPTEPQTWLTAREFFEFLKVLPAETAFRLDPQVSLRNIRGWMEDHPDFRRAFPIPSILRKLEDAPARGR